MSWRVRDLAPEETHDLRRRVSADGRADVPTFHHPLDDSPGAWHLGVVDAGGAVVGISSYYRVPCPSRPGVEPAVQLQFMAVAPVLQRHGAGSAILAEALRRLRREGIRLVWADARDVAIPFYERFGFVTIDGTGHTPGSGRPHHLIALDLTAPGGPPGAG